MDDGARGEGGGGTAAPCAGGAEGTLPAHWGAPGPLGPGSQRGQGEGGESPGRSPVPGRPWATRPREFPGAGLLDGNRGRGYGGDAALPGWRVHAPDPKKAPGCGTGQVLGREDPGPHGLEDHQEVLYFLPIGRVDPDGGRGLILRGAPALGHGHLGSRPTWGARTKDLSAIPGLHPKAGGGPRPPVFTPPIRGKPQGGRDSPSPIARPAAPEETIGRPRALTIRWP